MGVQNLLPLVGPVAQRVPLSTFKGKRIAIDGFVWLHRCAFCCSREICQDPGTERILPYLATKLRRVMSSGIVPIIVFDGQSLPQKFNTNEKRHQQRAASRETAISLEERGLYNEAVHYYQKAVEITSQTVYTWIGELKKNGIEYIVAPYEADAQLAFLARSGYVDYVLTEDSDMLPYQTPVTLFKLDDMNMVTMVKYSDVLSHLQLTSDQFTAVCCLAGCDYLEHINKMGIQTALKTIRAAGDGASAIAALRAGGKFDVPADYEDQLARAMMTFKGQRVYNPIKKILQCLEPVENPGDFLGPDLAPDLLKLVVSGEVDTRTLQRLKPEEPTGEVSPYFQAKRDSPPSRSPTSSPKPSNPEKSPYFKRYKAKKEEPVQARRITSYFQLAPR